MNTQINLRLPESILIKAKRYAEKHGFDNVQEMIKEDLREKFCDEPELTNEQAMMIKKLIDYTNKNNLWIKEKDLFKKLNEKSG